MSVAIDGSGVKSHFQILESSKFTKIFSAQRPQNTHRGYTEYMRITHLQINNDNTACFKNDQLQQTFLSVRVYQKLRDIKVCDS